MHIYCGPLYSGFYGSNCNYYAGGTNTYLAKMNSPVVTTGYTSVNLKFWWLCNGSSTAFGNVYYRTSTSGAWTLVTVPITNYSLSSTWNLQTIHLAAFDNQAALEFAFQFTEDMVGSDPAFGIDDISVLGTPAGAAPVASFTTSPTPATVCQDSCITFTSTSTGSIDSIRWVACVSGIPVYLLGNTTPYNLYFPSSLLPAGTYGMRLRVYGGGKVDSITKTITINPAPHPVITKTGSVLSVSTAYTAYQWSNTSGPIAGATTSSYTYPVVSTYTVIVDSGGCKGSASINIATLGVSNVNGLEKNYWVTQSGNGTITLNASEILGDLLNINMYDATGRQILNEAWPAGTNSLQVSGLSLSPGLYIIKLSNRNTSAVLKLMK